MSQPPGKHPEQGECRDAQYASQAGGYAAACGEQQQGERNGTRQPHLHTFVEDVVAVARVDMRQPLWVKSGDEDEEYRLYPAAENIENGSSGHVEFAERGAESRSCKPGNPPEYWQMCCFWVCLPAQLCP